MSDLGSIIRRCPLASAAVRGDCYSLGYSVAHESVVANVCDLPVLASDRTDIVRACA